MLKNRRIKYFVGFVVSILIEMLIALYVHDKIIRPYIGDVLVIICIYLLLKTIFDTKIKHLALYIFIFAVSVELMQYFKIMQYLSKGNDTLKIALGTTFDIKDIVCYFVGYVVIVLGESVRDSYANNMAKHLK
ncbi:MAG: DUF2809 domain-containing protein [Clostridia bacterium]|nr:DUF2809 domain-containing protein [Clostridia bacterium]